MEFQSKPETSLDDKDHRLDEYQIMKCLMDWRPRLLAAAWSVTRDGFAAEDIFQNVALKSITRRVVFRAEAALVSWAYVATRREGIDWLDLHAEQAGAGDGSARNGWLSPAPTKPLVSEYERSVVLVAETPVEPRDALGHGAGGVDLPAPDDYIDAEVVPPTPRLHRVLDVVSRRMLEEVLAGLTRALEGDNE